MNYLLLGGGMQGTAIAFDLLRNVDDTTMLTVVERDEESLAALRDRLDDPRLEVRVGDVLDRDALRPLMQEADTVVSAVNYWFNFALAEQAVECGAHFLDLGGNNDVVERELGLDAAAREHGVSVVPDCGLAPGLAGILGHELHGEFESVESLRLRVGGLPLDPQPPLDYMLVFAVQGLINEYIEPCVVVRDGRTGTVPGMSELEELSFPEPFGRLEAFQTSGGCSTLPRTLAGKVRNLDYKTIRYPGHCEKIRLLMDLGLTSSETVPLHGGEFAPRDVLGHLLEQVLPREGRDVVLVLVEADGVVAGRRVRRSIRIVDEHDPVHDISAMMRMTGFPAAIVARMLALGEIARPGAWPQELILPAGRMAEELARRGIHLQRAEEPLDG